MTSQNDSFPKRVLVAALVSSGVVIALLAVWHTASILFLVLSGVLLGVFLDALTRLVRDRLRVGRSAALSLVCFLFLALGTAFFWVAGPSMVRQIGGLGEQLPAALEALMATARSTSTGAWVLDQMPEASRLTSGTALFGRIGGFFSTVFGAVGGTLVVIVIGLYLAANPYVYRDSVVRLVPPRSRARLDEIIGLTGHALRRWLLGRMASMLIVGILTTVGLQILGIPLALVLGLIAALLDFVPNLGPVLASIPAILIAVVESPLQGLYVVILYAAVQTLEAYLLTPLIEQYAVHVPPALLITVQVIIGYLFGIVGLLMATPLLVIVVLLVQTLYVEDTLGERVRELGTPE
ncbi:MAG TPA: AI-2E family transporter [Rhodothermales bacterium]